MQLFLSIYLLLIWKKEQHRGEREGKGEGRGKRREEHRKRERETFSVQRLTTQMPAIAGAGQVWNQHPGTPCRPPHLGLTPWDFLFIYCSCLPVLICRDLDQNGGSGTKTVLQYGEARVSHGCLTCCITIEYKNHAMNYLICASHNSFFSHCPYLIILKLKIFT